VIKKNFHKNIHLEFSVVIPAYNEEGSIEEVLTELLEVLGTGPEYEVVVVDDGSTDKTKDILSRLITTQPFLKRLHVVRHPRSFGKSTALRTAARHARGEWLLTMDADGQNDPRDFKMLRTKTYLDNPPALVCGIRTNRKATGARRIASRSANFLRRIVLDDDCPDTACGVKYIRRDVFMELPLFDGQHRFYPALVKLYGHDISNINVSDRERMAGQSKYTNMGRALVGFFDLLGVLWLRKRTKPPIF